MILRTSFHSIITLPQGFYLNIQEHLFLPKTASLLSPKASSISFPTAGFKGIHGLSNLFPTWSIDNIEISLYAPTHHWMVICTESQYLTWPYVTALGATQTILDRNGSSIQLLFSRFSQTMCECSQFDLRHQLQGLIQAQMVTAKKLFWRRAIGLNQWQFQSVWCTVENSDVVRMHSWHLMRWWVRDAKCPAQGRAVHAHVTLTCPPDILRWNAHTHILLHVNKVYM